MYQSPAPVQKTMHKGKAIVAGNKPTPQTSGFGTHEINSCVKNRGLCQQEPICIIQAFFQKGQMVPTQTHTPMKGGECSDMGEGVFFDAHDAMYRIQNMGVSLPNS